MFRSAPALARQQNLQDQDADPEPAPALASARQQRPQNQNTDPEPHRCEVGAPIACSYLGKTKHGPVDMRLAGTRMHAACRASLRHLQNVQPADTNTGALCQLTTPAAAPAPTSAAARLKRALSQLTAPAPTTTTPAPTPFRKRPFIFAAGTP